MKGIILSAGKSSRLYPITLMYNKVLLPIYDKPMLYYPLATLINVGIKDILIIVSEEDLNLFKTLIGDGSQLGLNITYEIQYVKRGTADAILIGEKFIGDDSVCLIFGDNLFFGGNINEVLEDALNMENGACVFGYKVPNPQNFGVPEFDKNGNVISIEEKPLNPKSDYAVTGLYFYDNKCIEYAKTLKPSKRGELEITDLNNIYLKNGKLKMKVLSPEVKWLDTGTADSLLSASNLVRSEQERMDKEIACLEEIVYNRGYIDKEQLKKLVDLQRKTKYGQYLENLIK